MNVERDGAKDRAGLGLAGLEGRSPSGSRQQKGPMGHGGGSPRSASDIVFVEPCSVIEARRRIADLDYDIAHIDQQIRVREARGYCDLDWRHRAARARMVKELERSRLIIWVEELRSGESWDFLKAIVEIVKADYDPDEWREVLREAQNRLQGGAAR